MTFESILNECNRLAAEQESRERGNWIKSRLLQLKIDYERGVIDEETYNKNEAEILKELGKAA